ncbi:hypothetical protein Tco_1290897 [Tanacetum coccineum]
MDLKLKLLNQIDSNKSNETYTTHKQLYYTLYESVILDQDALDAQAAQLSFHKRSHDNQDPFNNLAGENKKKRRKDVGEPSSRSSRRNRSPVVIIQDDTPVVPSTVVIEKKFKELIQKDELTIGDLKRARLERLKVHYKNNVELEYHASQLKAAVLSEAQWNSDEGDVSKPRSFERHMSKSIEDWILERWSKEVRRYHFEALNGIHHWEEDRIDFFKAGMSVVTEGNVYSDLRIKSVVHLVVKKKWGYGFLTSIIVKRSDDKEYEFSYSDLPRLDINDVEDMYLLQENHDQEQGRRYSTWSGKLLKNSQPHQTQNVLHRNRPKDTIHDDYNA